MTFKQRKSEDPLLIALDSIYFLHRTGDHESAHSLYLESKSEFEKFPLHRATARLLELIGKYEQNKLEAADCAEMSNALKPNIYKTDNNLYLGWIHFLIGYYSKNQDELNKAAKLFTEGLFYNELYEVYYWMDSYKLLPADEKIISFLRLYPAQSIYSKIMGNDFYQEQIGALTQIQKNQAKSWLHEESNERFDCWLIKNKSITPAHYISLELKGDTFLDLYSGLIKDRGEHIFLMLSELNCLAYLLGTQLTGATLPNLAEFLNRSEDETSAVIDVIKSMGIPIKKIQDLYFLQWEEKPLVIIARGLKVLGLQEYVKRSLKTFTKNQLIDLLELTQFGAESLMKKWALAGLIRPVDKQDNNVWKFL